MKTLFIILFAVVAMSGDALAQGKKFSEYPNSATLQAGDLFLFSRGGAGTFNIDAFSQMPTALGLGTAAYTASTAYDASGVALSATNGMGLASGLAAFRPTNTFDVANSALNATNGIGIASGYSAFVPTNRFASSNVATTAAAGISKPDGSTITITSDGTISAVSGGSGNVTGAASSIDSTLVFFQGTSGKIITNRTAAGSFTTASFDAAGAGTTAATAATNGLGTAAFQPSTAFITPAQQSILSNNLNAANLVGTIPHGSLPSFTLTNNWQGTIIAAGISNTSLTASTLLKADANKRESSIANGVGALTNDASGNFGYVPLLDASTLTASHHVRSGATTNLEPWEDFTGYTNSVSYTNYGTGTNLTFTFDGNIHEGTATNGPTLYVTYAVSGNSSGSWSVEIPTNVAISFPYAFNKWLAGSNASSSTVFSITNGVLSVTAYGSTNASRMKPAIIENQ